MAISSSPRLHGNSDLLCDQFLKGAAEAGHSVKKDDMADILDDVISADMIVLAAPVYFYAMSVQMRIFIDRCFARFREIKGKDFCLIATAAAPQREAAEETIAGLRDFLRCLPEAQEKKILCGSGG